MSAIGGIMNLNGDNIDFSDIERMKMSMALRGRAGGSAFLKGAIGIFYSSSTEEDRQPYICEKDGNVFCLCIDGCFDTSVIMEKYFALGEEALGLICGFFSLALYDGAQKKLILARDRQGRRPLFYKISEKGIAFASEVKGLSDGCIYLNGDALSSHLISPVGKYGAQDIYIDVYSVDRGELVAFDGEGISRSYYKTLKGQERISSFCKRSGEEVLLPNPALDTSRIGEYLGNAQLAFDFPQFDVYMPPLMDMLSNVSVGAEVIFQDQAREYSLAYSYDRQDRLGAIYGVDIFGVPPREKISFSSEELYSFERALFERLLSKGARGAALARQVLGVMRYDALFSYFDKKDKKAEDTENSIRILGMLCQLIDWSEAEQLVIA